MQNQLIDLQTPIRHERVRGFQPPWRTIFIYRCHVCGNETKARASRFIGSHPVPSTNAISCPHCLAATARMKP